MLTTKNDLLVYVNRNYCITSHLAERIDELTEQPFFHNSVAILKQAVKLLEQQLDDTHQIYESLDVPISFEGNDALIAFLDDMFSKVCHYTNGVSLIALLDYVLIADALLKESAKFIEICLDNTPSIALPQSQFYDSQIFKKVKQLVERITVLA